MPLKLIPPRIGKTPYWSVRGTYLGVYLDRSTKAHGRSQAAKFLAKWKGEIERGTFASPSEPTFLDAAVRYMADTGNERFVRPVLEYFGSRSRKSIDQQAIDDASLALYPNATAATRNRQVHTVVSAILKHAGDPSKLRRPKGWRGKKETHWLWPEQAFKIFEVAGKIDPEFGIFLVTLCYTGMRLGEATERFRIDALSLQEGFGYVPLTKNTEPRAVHLPPVVVAALANHPRGLDRPGQTVFKFRKNGRIYALLNQVRSAVGPSITIKGFHTFRHTWATWMRRYGGLDTTGLIATQAWKDPASARRYEHTIASEESRKADLLPVEKSWKLAMKASK